MKINNSSLIIVILTLLSIQLVAQQHVNPRWALNSTGERWDVVTDQDIDNNGNIYLTGNFTGTFGYDTKSEQISGEKSLFIAKFNPESELLWLKKMGSTGFVSASSIQVGNSDDVFVCGNFSGEINEKEIDLTTKQHKSGYIIKLNSTGNIQWANQIEGALLSSQMHIAPDQQGGVYFAGAFRGKLNFQMQAFNSRYYKDIILVHYNKDGSTLAVNSITGSDDENIFGLTSNSIGDVFATGSFKRELKFDQHLLTSNGLEDAYVIQMDSRLRAVKAKHIGGIYDDEGRAIAFNKQGKLLLVGNFTGAVDFGKTVTLESEGTRDVFVLSLDESLDCNWGSKFGSPGSDCVTGLAVNNRNDVYLIGSFRGEMKSNDESISSKSFANDAFLAKFSSDGSLKFIENIGGEAHDFGKSINIDHDNEILISGNFSGQLDMMGKRSANSHGEDLFISRLHDCDATDGITLPADTVICGSEYTIAVSDEFESYFWNGIKGNHEYKAEASGQIVVEAINRFGCNSFDTMNLVLSTPPPETLPDTIRVQQGEILTLEAPEGMREYLWSDGSNLPFLEVNTSALPAGISTYWMEVIEDNGCLAYDEVSLKVTSLKNHAVEAAAGVDKENNSGFELTVFPNPASEKILIELTGLDINCPVTIELYSQKGNLLLTETRDLTEVFLSEVIQINTIPPGTCLLKICNGGNVVNLKVVVL